MSPRRRSRRIPSNDKAFDTSSERTNGRGDFGNSELIARIPRNLRCHHGLRRDMLLRVVPEEGQDVLPEDSTPRAKELPSPTSHSNRSLRTEVCVAGKRNFQGRDKEAETALEIQGRRCRDKISLGNSANSGLFAEPGNLR